MLLHQACHKFCIYHQKLWIDSRQKFEPWVGSNRVEVRKMWVDLGRGENKMGRLRSNIKIKSSTRVEGRKNIRFDWSRTGLNANTRDQSISKKTIKFYCLGNLTMDITNLISKLQTKICQIPIRSVFTENHSWVFY